MNSPLPTRRRITIAMAALAIFAVGVLPGATAAGKPHRPLYWGAQIGAQLTGEAAPWDPGAIHRFESMVGKPMSLISFGAPFANCRQKPCLQYGFPTTPMQTVREAGAVPMFSWGSEGSQGTASESAFQLEKIVHGRYDGYIRHFAESAKEWGHPFFLRFDWEMNGFWFSWGQGVNRNKPHQFVAAWRHVYKIFQHVGATNATWVWCPNVDFTRKLSPLDALYPGNKYVDWTCMDGFNWGKTRDSIGWQSFHEVFHSTYKRILAIAPKKPMMVGETASDDRGGSKPNWIKAMLKTIPQSFPKIRALVWYDEEDQGMHWPLDHSRKSISAFAKGISHTIYQPNRYGLLADGKIGPPTWADPPIEPEEEEETEAAPE